MRIIVFGATGRTGRHVVREAVERGHEVVAAVRDPSGLADVTSPNLSMQTMDPLDPEDVTRVVAAADPSAVISTLGPREKGPTTVCRSSAHAQVTALRATDVRRLLVTSATAFHTEGDGPFTRYAVKPVLGRLLRHGIEDLRAMEETVMASELDWTVVRPSMLVDVPGTGSCRREVGRNVRGGYRTPRPDLASTLLDCVDDPTTVHCTVAVAR